MGTILTAVDPVTSEYVPSFYSAHPSCSWVFVNALDHRAAEGDNNAGFNFIVTATYGTVQYAPWQLPAVWGGGQQNDPVPLDYDVNTGHAVKNSASQKFDPTPTTDRYSQILTIQKSIVGFDYFGNSNLYVGTVNNGSWHGVAEGYALCTGMPFSQNTYTASDGTQTIYYDVTFNIAIKNAAGDDWQLHIADTGFQQIGPSGGLVNIVIGGREPASPCFLDGTGHLLAVGGTPVFLDYDNHVETDFSALEALWS